MSTAAPTFALSMPLSLCPATSVSKAAARVMAICIPGFNYNAMLQKPPVGAIGIPGAAGTTSEFGAAAGSDAVQYSDRSLNINQTAQGILEANDPPVRMLWVACKTRLPVISIAAR